MATAALVRSSWTGQRRYLYVFGHGCGGTPGTMVVGFGRFSAELASWLRLCLFLVAAWDCGGTTGVGFLLCAATFPQLLVGFMRDWSLAALPVPLHGYPR